ncbi:2-amino-4-hydroxy-6-hydroxymethyldihydropteridine diphosphokinase [candidate division KSB1 bacterium]|nr:2-amino-4-hydroxy-6-hydroxymethyldihydropteridine diphosphokinase [candidate division KSB1 bacterium]
MQNLYNKNRKFLGLGSNIENRLSNLRECIRRLLQIPGLILKQWSPIYETRPIDNSPQENFLNMVVEIDYLSTPLQLR